LREVKEEYGVVGIIEKQLPAHSLLRVENKIKTHWLIITYLVKVDRKKVILGYPEKMIDLNWFKLNELPQFLHPGAKFTLKKYKKKFEKYL